MTRLNRSERALSCVLLCLLVQGCANTVGVREAAIDESFGKAPKTTRIPQQTPYTGGSRSRRGNPPSYVVFGKRYEVLPDSQGFHERGIASWYGPYFHGRPTSSGEPFNMFELTAAHKTLPLPTFVRVTNLENNRSVVVRVNDRGPFFEDRIIDVSYSAAEKLDLVDSGIGLVEVEAIDPPEGVEYGETQAGEIYLQIGAFSNRDNALKVRDSVNYAELPGVRIQTGGAGQDAVYRVQVGPFDNRGKADEVANLLYKLGFASIALIMD